MVFHGRTRKIGSLGFILGIFIATTITYPAYASQSRVVEQPVDKPIQSLTVSSLVKSDSTRDAISVEVAATRVAPPSSRYAGVVPAGNSAIIQTAMAYIGVPYVYAGASPSGFDCSGFTMFVYAQYGISLPHSAGAQTSYGTPIPESQAQPGDLVYLPGHVGLWYAPGLMIDAPVLGQTVDIHAMWGGYTIYRIG